jgi:hypothetical protein
MVGELEVSCGAEQEAPGRPTLAVEEESGLPF